MNPKLKTVLLILGLLASLLIVSQLAMGLMSVRGGAGYALARLIKTHQHSGYRTVTVVLLYVAVSLGAILRTPSRPRA